MENKDEIVKIYTGDKVSIQHLKTELELNGIISHIKDGFKQGNDAGFVGGIPNLLDLYVVKSDEKKANEIKSIILA